MFEIGASLREARTRRGLSAEDVQKAIRIRDRYLTALEQEDWALLPGDAYTKGFLRAYAEFLGLDGSLYVDEFNSRFARRYEQPFMPEPLSPIGRRSVGLLRPLLAIGVIVAVVAGVAAWQLSRGSGTAGPSTATDVGGTTSTGTAKSKPPATPTTSRPKRRAARPAATSRRAVLTAARGRVWLLVRSGGPDGQGSLRRRPRAGKDATALPVVADLAARRRTVGARRPRGRPARRGAPGTRRERLPERRRALTGRLSASPRPLQRRARPRARPPTTPRGGRSRGPRA